MISDWIASQNPYIVGAYVVVLSSVPDTIESVAKVVENSPDVGAATSIMGMVQMVVTILVGLSVLALNLVKIYDKCRRKRNDR